MRKKISASILSVLLGGTVAMANASCPQGESQLIVNYNAHLRSGLLYSTYGIGQPLIRLPRQNASFLNTHYKWLSHSKKQWSICLLNNNNEIQYVFNGATNQLHYYMFPNNVTTINIETKGWFGLSTKAVLASDQSLDTIKLNVSSLSQINADFINQQVEESGYKAGHPVKVEFTLTQSESRNSSLTIPTFSQLKYPVIDIAIQGETNNHQNQTTITDNINTDQAVIVNPGNAPKVEINNLNFTTNAARSVALEADMGGHIDVNHASFSGFSNTLLAKNKEGKFALGLSSHIAAKNSTFILSSVDQNSKVVLASSDSGKLAFGSIITLENPEITVDSVNRSRNITLLDSSNLGIAALNIDARTNTLTDPSYHYLQNNSHISIQSFLFSVENGGVVAIRDHSLLNAVANKLPAKLKPFVNPRDPDGEYNKFISANTKDKTDLQTGHILSANGFGSFAVLDTNDTVASNGFKLAVDGTVSRKHGGIAAINPIRKIIAAAIKTFLGV
ncbi:hypothetical protein [Cysteiniphilum halobium]|uniref:hypothetical protein n=1 Tax=Cysteiniphilum halobium TaxID=2219059 RepID=UPI003F86866F